MTESRRRPDRSVGLTPAIIEALKRRINPSTGKRYTQSDIAEMYGITRQRVSQIKLEVTNFSRTDRERARDIYPFLVPKEPFQHAAPDKWLRNHAEYMVSGGKGMSEEKLRRLRWFYNKLRRDNVVVIFGLDVPPSEENKHGGYAYVPRTEGDGDFLVRFNEDCPLNEEEKLLWRFPPVEP